MGPSTASPDAAGLPCRESGYAPMSKSIPRVMRITVPFWYNLDQLREQVQIQSMDLPAYLPLQPGSALNPLPAGPAVVLDHCAGVDVGFPIKLLALMVHLLPQPIGVHRAF